MELVVAVFIWCWLPAASGVYWIVSNKPVIYGDNIILTCKTGDVLTDIGETCGVRQWYSGQKQLLYNGVPIDATKYEGGTNLATTEFFLVIKNYTESDLNINYTCSCGFKSYTKRLGLNDNNFIVPPLRVDTHIQQSNETISIFIHVERVYPRPLCSVVIGERTVFEMLIFTSVKPGKFYYGTYEARFNIIDDDRGKKPTLFCYIGNKYNIVNTPGETIRNGTEVNGDGGNTPGYISTSTEAYTAYILVSLGVALSAVVFIGVIIIWKYIQKRKRTLNTRIENILDSDGDHRNKMLAMKSKIHKQNDSGFELNDYSVPLMTSIR